MTPRIPRIAVGAVLVRDDRLLLVQRAEEPARGLWTLPGGRLEHGEYIGDAVKREVLEETGLHVEVGALLGVFEVLGDQHYVILDHLVTADEGQEPRPGSDAAAVRWVHFGELAHIECTPRLVEMLMAWGVVPAN